MKIINYIGTLGIVSLLLSASPAFAEPYKSVVPSVSPSPSLSTAVQPPVQTFSSLTKETNDLKAAIESYKKTGISSTQKKAILNRIDSIKSAILALKNTSGQISVQSNSQVDVKKDSTQQASTLFCHNFYMNLAQGSSGNQVIALSKILTDAGFGNSMTSAGYYSALYDSNMVAQVKKYQKSQSIETTGTVGPLTRKSLNTLFGCQNVDELTVVAPQGTSFKKGDTMMIQWVTNGAFGVKKIVLLPVDPHLNDVVVLNQSYALFPITGSSYTWKIPEDVAAGSYKIQITVGYSLQSPVSNTPFTIVDNAVVPPPPALPTSKPTPTPYVTPVFTSYMSPSPTQTHSPTPIFTPYITPSPSPSPSTSVIVKPTPTVTSSPRVSPTPYK